MWCTMPRRLTVATLNMRGLPLKGSSIPERFTAIAAEFDVGDIDLVCLQEVFAYHHLAHLRIQPTRGRSQRSLTAARAGRIEGHALPK